MSLSLVFLPVQVSVDAVIVLSGGVLTAFVGVTGLIRRMSMDRYLALSLRFTRILDIH
jgi:hypothetical protein